MKLLRKSNLFTTSIMMVILFSVIGFVGCEKADELNKTDIILESEEFENYYLAVVEFGDQLSSIYSRKNQISNRVIDEKSVGNVKNSVSQIIDSEFIAMQDAKLLLEKRYSYLDAEMLETLISQKKDSFRNFGNKNIPRLKSADMESNSSGYKVGTSSNGTIYTRENYNYDKYPLAFKMAEWWSKSTNNEIGGYIFNNGSAVLYIDSRNHHSGNTKPVLSDSDIMGSFHTHFHSGNYSRDDATQTGDYYNHMQYYPSSDLVILYNGSAYTYSFDEYGKELDTPRNNYYY